MSKRTLSDKIADDIFNMIVVEKRFKIGDKILSEKEFAQELNVSRATFREGVKQLVERGILEVKQGSGTFVAKDAEDLDKINMGSVIDGGAIEAKDLMEVRLVLEPEMAYLAAQRATETEMKRIFYYGKCIEELVKQGKEQYEMNQKFHMAIMQAAHNTFIDRLTPVLFVAINQTSSILWKSSELKRGTIEEHRMVMECIKNRDGEGAKAVMKFHLLKGMRNLKKQK